MFLRSLASSRMPQARYPRADDQVSNYWKEDTESSREIVRAMTEIDEEDEHAMVDKKISLPAIIANGNTRRARSASQPLLHVSTTLAPTAHVLGELDGLSIEDMESAPIQAQLSPTGLISIAAADIDGAARDESVPAELDLELLEAIRRAAIDEPALSNGENDRRIVIDNVLTRMLSSAQAAVPSTGEDSTEGQLRFLSLLRRINELRSQQVQPETDVWDGLPYPQILALPTFKYQVRQPRTAQVVGMDEKTDSDSSSCADLEHRANTMCAVCYTEYAPEEEVRALPCLHFYHRECIDQWLLHHRICPICKHIVAVY